MSQEVLSLVLNKCDVKHIASNLKSSGKMEKEEKKSLLESLAEAGPHDYLILNENEQLEKCQYHAVKIAESLGMPVPQEIAEQVERIAFAIPRKDHIGFFSKKPTIQSCSAVMNKSVYEYIIKEERLNVPFYPPIKYDIKPKGFINVQLIDGTSKIEVTQNDLSEVTKNAKPEWWDDSRNFNEAHMLSQYVKMQIDQVNRINGITGFKTYTLAAKKLLTDACFTFKPLSREQILLTYIILQGVTYTKASGFLHKAFQCYPVLSKKRVTTCLRRTLNGSMFDSSKVYHSCGYLGYIDSLILITELDLKIAAGKGPDSSFVAKRARELFADRMYSAKLMYQFVKYKKPKCDGSSDEGDDDEFSSVPEFSTDWVGKFIKRAGFIRTNGEKLERDRGIHCTASALIRWSLQFGNILESYANNGQLLFNFDEAMIAVGGDATKFISRKGNKKPIEIKADDPQHLTVGCCFNSVGIKVPLFIILNKLQNLPSELESYKSQDVFFSTQGNGWIDKKLFYAWALMFCQWLNDYRKQIHRPDDTVTLLLDSHNSRADSDVLELFKQCNVRLITFPPHCTHALQPFDVGVARNLKYYYTRFYKEALAERDDSKLKTAAKRQIAVECIIRAWHQVLTPPIAECAFQKTGLLPFNTGVMLMARGVNTISTLDPEKEERRIKDRLFISSSELTSDEMIRYIKDWEIKNASTKKAIKEGEKQNKSLIFSKLDPEIIIKGYAEVKCDIEIKEQCIKGLHIMKPVKSENDASNNNSLISSSQEYIVKNIAPSQLVSPAPSPVASTSNSTIVSPAKISIRNQLSVSKKEQEKKQKTPIRLAKLNLPMSFTSIASSQLC